MREIYEANRASGIEQCFTITDPTLTSDLNTIVKTVSINEPMNGIRQQGKRYQIMKATVKTCQNVYINSLFTIHCSIQFKK